MVARHFFVVRMFLCGFCWEAFRIKSRKYVVIEQWWLIVYHCTSLEYNYITKGKPEQILNFKLWNLLIWRLSKIIVSLADHFQYKNYFKNNKIKVFLKKTYVLSKRIKSGILQFQTDSSIWIMYVRDLFIYSKYVKYVYYTK